MSFHFSSHATVLFLPVIIQPELNSWSGELVHNVALSVTLSVFIHFVSFVYFPPPPTVSPILGIPGVFRRQKLKLNWRQRWSVISFIISIPPLLFSSLTHSCAIETVSSFWCQSTLQPERATWFVRCHSLRTKQWCMCSQPSKMYKVVTACVELPR